MKYTTFEERPYHLKRINKAISDVKAKNCMLNEKRISEKLFGNKLHIYTIKQRLNNLEQINDCISKLEKYLTEMEECRGIDIDVLVEEINKTLKNNSISSIKLSNAMGHANSYVSQAIHTGKFRSLMMIHEYLKDDKNVKRLSNSKSTRGRKEEVQIKPTTPETIQQRRELRVVWLMMIQELEKQFGSLTDVPNDNEDLIEIKKLDEKIRNLN